MNTTNSTLRQRTNSGADFDYENMESGHIKSARGSDIWRHAKLCKSIARSTRKTAAEHSAPLSASEAELLPVAASVNKVETWLTTWATCGNPYYMPLTPIRKPNTSPEDSDGLLSYSFQSFKDNLSVVQMRHVSDCVKDDLGEMWEVARSRERKTRQSTREAEARSSGWGTVTVVPSPVETKTSDLIDAYEKWYIDQGEAERAVCFDLGLSLGYEAVSKFESSLTNSERKLIMGTDEHLTREVYEEKVTDWREEADWCRGKMLRSRSQYEEAFDSWKEKSGLEWAELPETVEELKDLIASDSDDTLPEERRR